MSIYYNISPLFFQYQEGNTIIYQYKMKENTEFSVKREQFAQNIRRVHREEIFQKRRNLGNKATEEKKDEQVDGKKIIVIDQRFREKVIQFNQMSHTKQQFIELVRDIYDADIIKQLHGLMGVRKLLSKKQNQPIQQTIDAGLVPKLIEYAKQTEYPQMQLQSIWCLSNVASGTTLQCSSIIDKGGIKIFVDLLLSEHPGIIQQAVWTLGNIACDLPVYRDNIISVGGLRNLINVIQVASTQLQKTPSMLQLIQTTSWALSTLCRNQPLPDYSKVKDAIQIFYFLLKNQVLKDKKIISNLCWAISYFSHNSKKGPRNLVDKTDKIQKCIDSDVVPVLLSYLQTCDDSMHVAIIRILGNIACGDDNQVAYLINNNVIQFLHKSILRNQKTVRRQSCWVLSNITAGNQSAIESVFSNNVLIKDILNIIENDLPSVQSDAMYVMINAVENGNKNDLVQFYRQIQLIKYYSEIIKSGKDIGVQNIALQCLDYLLQLGLSVSGQKSKNIFARDLYSLNMIEVLEQLQYSDEDKIYESVSKILNSYFDLQNPTSENS